MEAWAIPSTGLRLINCTYPLRTSKIIDLLNYRISDKSQIQYKDIFNIKHLKERLNNKDDDPLYLYIRSLLSKNTLILLSLNDSNEAYFHKAILKDFNTIINRPSDLDFNISHFDKSKVIPRRSLRLDGNERGLYQGFSNSSSGFLSMNDYRLFKRRLLEDAFQRALNESLL